jgi:hypothetical protein
MHQRIFHYALFVYAFGFIAAVTLNIDIYEQVAPAPLTAAAPKLPSAASNALMECKDAPDAHVVASATPSPPNLEPIGMTPDCAHRMLEVVPVPGAVTSQPAAIPVEAPLVRQDL